MENSKVRRQVETMLGPSGWKLRTSSKEGDRTVWLFVPGMWHTDSFSTFGCWPRFVSSQPDTASATLVLRGREEKEREGLVAGWDNYSTLSDYVDDIRDAFVHLTKQFDHIVICGHSMGGLLVHLTTQSLPEQVRKNLSAAVTMCESTSVVAQMAWNAVTSRNILEIMAGEPFMPHPKDVEKYILSAGWNLPAKPAFSYESGVAARQLLLGQFKIDFASAARPKVPHIVVGSEIDPLVPRAAVLETLLRMKRAGMNAHYFTARPGGHMIMLCRDAEETIMKLFVSVRGHTAQQQRCAAIVPNKKNQEFAA